MALFEQLIELDAYEARTNLDEIDGRFRELPLTPRPRLARRSTIRGRRTRR